MREYIFHQALSRDSTFVFPALRRLVRNWLARKNLRRLEQLDDYLLNDIGMSRADIRHALKLPYDIDPVDEMTRLREQRIRRGVRSQ